MIEDHYYSRLTSQGRRELRNAYAAEQEGLCMYCAYPLHSEPPDHVKKPIDWRLFPNGFLKYPVHLQHNHTTDLTEGAVHAYCNAVMWQYEGR